MIKEANRELKRRRFQHEDTPEHTCPQSIKDYVEAMIGVDKRKLEQAQIKPMKKVTKHLKEKLRERKLEDVMQEHIAVILHELKHCFVNHSDDSWPWKSFDFVHQTAVMTEEAGEAVRAANNMREGKGDQMALYNELAQTAAMCLRIMDQIKEYSVYGNNSH